MKRKIKVGIPRSLLYYRYGELWKTFFKLLNCNVILGPINKEINTKDNIKCLLVEEYINQIKELKDKCDYILITDIHDYFQNNKVCPLLSYNKEIKNIITKRETLNYKIKYTSFLFEFIAMIKLGIKFNKNPIRIVYAYIKGLKKQKQYNLNKEYYQKNLQNKNNKKILIMSNFYLLETPLINKIINYLNQKGIISLLSSRLDKKIALLFSSHYEENLGNKYLKEMVGSYYYYQNFIEGVIYLKTNNCLIDLIIENTSIIRQKKPYLILNINNKNYEKEIDNFISKI